MVYIVLLLLSCSAIIMPISAQNYVGIEHSSYMPMEQIHLNPAKIVDSRMKYDINILSASYFYNNNFYLGRTIFSPLFSNNTIQRLRLNHVANPILTGLTRIQNQYAKGNIADAPVDVSLMSMVEYRGPSVIYNLGKDLKRKHSVAFFLKARTITSITGLNRNYLGVYSQRIRDNLDDDAFVRRLDNLRFRFADGFSYLTNVYNEIGISYGSEIYKTKRHIISTGISLKRYNGIYLSALKANNLFLRFDAPPVIGTRDAFVESDMMYANSNPDGAFNYINPLHMFNYGQILNGNGGWGIDLGFTYAFIPDSTSKYEIIDSAKGIFQEVRCNNKYLLKLSLSVTDLGYMRYKVANFHQLPLTHTTIRSWENHINDLFFFNTLVKNTPNQPNKTITVIAPTMLRADADFHFPTEKKIWRNLYLNVGYNQSISKIIAGKNNFNNDLWSYLNLAPRLEQKDWEIALPISSFLINVPQKPFIRIGLSARYKYFFIGSADLPSLIGISTQGGSLYAGVKYGVAYNCPKPFEDSLRMQDSIRLVPDSLRDRDHDGVPDVKDKCIDTPGAVSNFGCPINQDSLFETTLKQTPWQKLFVRNTDVINVNKTPYLDSLATILIANPRFRILVSGEADDPSQGKKMMDSLAEARTEALLKYMKNKGVPDEQMIGVAMRSEQPLNIVPPFRQYIVGKDDERDGIFDNIDRCPTVPGLLTEEGCPGIHSTNEEKIITCLGEKIEFWKGLGSFAYASEANLDEVASIMKRNPRLRLLVRTFVGREILDRQAKEALAQQRANTIKSHIVRRGIAPNRIIALGMSPYEPLGSVPTIKYLQGPEDQDRDQVLDSIDRCPTLKGLPNLSGCPTEEMGNVYLRIDSLSNRIQFLEDKEELDIKSAPLLVSIVNILRKYPKINILISGLVNSTKLNKRQRNTLANKRAKVLQDYLIGFGIHQRRLDVIGIDWQQPTSLISKMRILDSHLSDGDGDGLKDYEDKCPTLEGTLANQGCPQVVYEEEEELGKLAQMIAFKPNKAEIYDTVYKYLERIVTLLKRNPTITLITYGNIYNSNLPKEKQDMLNIERAQFLYNYLAKRGLPKCMLNYVGISYLEKQPWLVPNILSITNTQDYDGDGVKDIYDRCPHTVGSPYNYGCPYDVEKIESAIADFTKKIYFNTNKYNLLPPATKALDKLARIMLADETLRFVISGNADNTGTQKINQPLSLNRAISVQQYLIKKGISADRLLPIGLSDRFPIGDNKTDFGRQENRSVRFQLLE